MIPVHTYVPRKQELVPFRHSIFEEPVFSNPLTQRKAEHPLEWNKAQQFYFVEVRKRYHSLPRGKRKMNPIIPVEINFLKCIVNQNKKLDYTPL